MRDYIQVSVRGWPDKKDDEYTRLIFFREEREKAYNILINLGGTYSVSSKWISEDEIPYRTSDELKAAQEILEWSKETIKEV